MKDIYEVLNEIDIDDDIIEELEVTDIEKFKVKKQLRQSFKSNVRLKRKILWAASLLFIFIGFFSVNSKASINLRKHITKDIFKVINGEDDSVYNKYNDYSDKIGTTKTDNDISVTLRTAIFDGRTVTYTYEIKSSRDLGRAPMFNQKKSKLIIKDYDGDTSGSSAVKKIDKNTFVYQEDFTIDKPRKNISFTIDFKDIRDIAERPPYKNIKGNWKFDINLKAVDVVTQDVNKSVEKNGVRFNIRSIEKTPVSFTLNYYEEIPESLRKKYDTIYVSLIEVKDDLGNKYKYSAKNETKTGIMLNFGSLDPKAEKLIIKSKVSMSPKPKNEHEKDNYIFDDMVIDLDFK